MLSLSQKGELSGHKIPSVSISLSYHVYFKLYSIYVGLNRSIASPLVLLCGNSLTLVYFYSMEILISLSSYPPFLALISLSSYAFDEYVIRKEF